MRVALCLVLAACGSGTPECTEYAAGQQMGVVEDPNLDEVSGLAASRTHDGTLWAHNDRGDGARLFAIAGDGAVQSTVTLRDVTASDFEDVAVEVDGGVSTVIVADTGDNELSRVGAVIYRFEEPDLTPSVVVDVQATTVLYPDGAVDIEALMVDPLTGDVLLLAKGGASANALYSVGTSVQRIGEVDLRELPGRSEATGADISPDGSTIAVRTPTHVLMWSRAGDVLDSLQTQACSVPIQAEDQGEAVAFAADGSGFFTLGEGVAQPLWWYARD